MVAVAAITVLINTGCLQNKAPLLPQSRGIIRSVDPSTCQSALAPDHAYATYQQVLKGLKTAQPISTISHLGCLVPPSGRSENSVNLYAHIIGHFFNINVLYGYLRKHFEANIAADRRLGNKRDAGLAWPGAYLSEAAILAYRRTGDERFLQLFTTYFDQVLNRRDILTGYHDAHRSTPSKAWSSINISTSRHSNHKGEPIMLAHITHTARITYPATEFARLVAEQPALKKRYGATAARYVAASRAAMDDFEIDRLPVKGVQLPGEKEPLRWYVRPVSESFEATNHIHMAAATWINLAQLTGDSKYRQRAITAIKVFEKGVEREWDGSVHWNYFPFFATRERKNYNIGEEYSEPTWKATLTTPFLIRAYRAGYPVSKQLVTTIANTIDTQILEDDRLRRNLSGKKSRWFDPQNRKDAKQLDKISNVAYFLEYAPLRPQISDQLKSLMGRRTDIFQEGWLDSEAAGSMAYAHFLKPAQLSRHR